MHLEKWTSLVACQSKNKNISFDFGRGDSMIAAIWGRKKFEKKYAAYLTANCFIFIENAKMRALKMKFSSVRKCRPCCATLVFPTTQNNTNLSTTPDWLEFFYYCEENVWIWSHVVHALTSTDTLATCRKWDNWERKGEMRCRTFGLLSTLIHIQQQIMMLISANEFENRNAFS